MLVRFYTDDDARLKVYGEFPSGCVRNMGGVLEAGQAFGNIPYATLASLHYGVIDWNNDTKIGSIMPSDDPRSQTAPYPTAMDIH